MHSGNLLCRLKCSSSTLSVSGLSLGGLELELNWEPALSISPLLFTLRYWPSSIFGHPPQVLWPRQTRPERLQVAKNNGTSPGELVLDPYGPTHANNAQQLIWAPAYESRYPEMRWCKVCSVSAVWSKTMSRLPQILPEPWRAFETFQRLSYTRRSGITSDRGHTIQHTAAATLPA